MSRFLAVVFSLDLNSLACDASPAVPYLIDLSIYMAETSDISNFKALVGIPKAISRVSSTQSVNRGTGEAKIREKYANGNK